MANFSDPANPTFVGVRQIETNDPVLGGAAEIASVVNSPANHALKSLVERTAYLKEEIEAITIPNATTSARGIAQLATVSEVNTGTNSNKIVTPYALQQKIDDIPDQSVPNATASQRGIVELANNSEAQTATDGTRAIVPSTLLHALRNGSSFEANASRKGVSQRATQAEVNAGTNTTKHLTPDTFNDSDQMASILPAATATLSASGSADFTLEENIAIGKILFMVIKANATILNNITWTLGGGAWRIMNLTLYGESGDRLFAGTNVSQSGITSQIDNIVFNNNNTQFRLAGGITSDDRLYVIAILN